MRQGRRPFEQTIRIPCRPSGRIFRILLLVHVLAFTSLFFTAIMLWIKISLAVVTGASMYRFYKAYMCEKDTWNRRQLLLNGDDEWRLIEGNGADREVNLLPATFVHPLLLVLRFVDDQEKHYSFVLTPDNVDQDSLRRLCVRLRFAGRS